MSESNNVSYLKGQSRSNLINQIIKQSKMLPFLKGLLGSIDFSEMLTIEFVESRNFEISLKDSFSQETTWPLLSPMRNNLK